MNTATSGYIQRRIVKLTEDIKIQYDGTVRDAIGSIYQSSYNELGIDPKATIKVCGEQMPCDVTSIVNKLNMKHETKPSKVFKKVVKKVKNPVSKDMDEILNNFGNMKV